MCFSTTLVVINTMKKILLFFAFMYSITPWAQELKFGSAIGSDYRFEELSAQLHLEYSSAKKPISLNFDPGITYYAKNSAVASIIPVYLKVDIGNKIKFCPTIGIFTRLGASYGWSGGLSMEYEFSNKNEIFIQPLIMTDYWKLMHPKGGTYRGLADSYFWFNLGFRRTIIRANKKEVNKE